MAETTMYTRGGLDEPDSRGPSLVQQRLEKLQKEKQDAALQVMAQLMPELGSRTHILALAEHDWNVEPAVAMLKLFQGDNADKLAALQKKRKKALKEAAEAEAAAAAAAAQEGAAPGAEEGAAAAAAAAAGAGAGEPPDSRSRRGRRGPSPSRSSSSSDASSSSSSSDDSSSGGSSDEEPTHKRKGRSKSKGSGKDKTKSKSKSKKRGRKEKRKKRSKSKKERGSAKRKRSRRDDSSGDSSSEDEAHRAKKPSLKDMTNPKDFGKYGLLKENDMQAKWNEFSLWAREVKQQDLETVGRVDERELFRSFMEDFNSATMPHRKYYDLVAYEREQALKAARKAAKRGGRQQRTARDDEEELRRERVAQRAKEAQERMQQALEEVRSGKAEDMRQQELLRAQMSLAYRTGDAAKAHKLQELLLPDHMRKDDKPPPKKL